jgi:Tol biopolymer transport system component
VRLAGLVLGAAAAAATAPSVSTSPAVSPDGKRLAWVDGETGRIWAANADGSGAHVLARRPTEEGVSDLRWTRDGLVVDSSFTLWLLSAGGGYRKLVPAGFFFAAGGDLVASGPERGPGRLSVENLATGRRYALGSPHVNNSQATISPDGTRVAWIAAGSLVTARLGRPPHRIAARAGCPAWSPDGRTIAFTRFPADELRVLPAAGGTGRLLASRIGGCSPVEWSPDSARVAFSGDTRLRIVDVASGAVVGTPASLGTTGAFAWAPDGSAIYATSRPPASIAAKSSCLSLVRLDPATLRGPVVVRGCP